MEAQACQDAQLKGFKDDSPGGQAGPMSLFNSPIAPVDLFNEPAFRLGAFHARPAVREVEVDGRVERLEPRVFQVLIVLARARNRTISRDDLIARCWNGRFVSDDALNRTIGKLRQLFARDPSGSVTIETVPRLGYQMRVDEADDRPSPSPFSYPHIAAGQSAAVSEVLGEAGRILAHALHAIEVSAGRGGAQLRLTIEMTTPGCGVLPGASRDPFADLTSLTCRPVAYRKRSPR